MCSLIVNIPLSIDLLFNAGAYAGDTHQLKHCP
jgi:hypothetical protein